MTTVSEMDAEPSLLKVVSRCNLTSKLRASAVLHPGQFGVAKLCPRVHGFSRYAKEFVQA